MTQPVLPDRHDGDGYAKALAAVRAGLLDMSGPALRSFLGSLLVLGVGLSAALGIAVVVAAVVAGITWYLVVLLFMGTTAVSAVTGVVVSVQRGVTAGVIHGVNRLSLARRGLDVLAARPEMRALEGRTVPLAEVETALKGAVHTVTTHADRNRPGWVRSRAEGVLFRQVEKVTLAALRREDGQVDFTRFASGFAHRIDGGVALHLTVFRHRWTTLAVTRLCLGVGGLALLLQLARLGQ